jgi:hypothetical protein
MTIHEEKPPLNNYRKDFTIINMQKRDYSRSRNRLHNNNSYSRNNSYLSDYNETLKIAEKKITTMHYDNFENYNTKRFDTIDLKTEASQTVELV